MKISGKLKELSNGKKSNWKIKAEYRIKNKKWLSYSSNIARRVLVAIGDIEDLNQRKLAYQIGVTPQYISKIVQGRENLSLETIAKLSTALNVELISFPQYKYSPPPLFNWGTTYLNAAIIITTGNQRLFASTNPIQISSNELLGMNIFLTNGMPTTLNSKASIFSLI